VAVDEHVANRQPRRSLLLVDAVKSCRLPQVPPREHIRERVVVDRLVVLVRTDHAVDVRPAAPVEAHPRRPVAGSLDEQVAARPGRERLVPGPG
jgi:hypothetical protein